MYHKTNTGPLDSIFMTYPQIAQLLKLSKEKVRLLNTNNLLLGSATNIDKFTSTKDGTFYCSRRANINTFDD